MAGARPDTLGEALWTKAVPKLVVKLAVAGVLAWIVRRALQRTPEPGMLGTGARVIGYGRPVAWVGGAGLTVALGVIAWASGLPEGRTAPLALGAILGLSQAALLATALGTTIEYDGSAISKRSFWKPPVTLLWSEVVTVTFRSGAGDFRFATADGRRLDVGMLMEGVGTLVGQLPRLVGPERSRDALAAHAKLRGRYRL